MQQHQNLAEHRVPSARLPTWHHDPSVASASVDLACLFCDVVARTVVNHEVRGIALSVVAMVHTLHMTDSTLGKVHLGKYT